MCEQAAEWTKVEAYPYVSVLSLTSELHLLLQFFIFALLSAHKAM